MKPPSQYLHNRTVPIKKLWRADMYRGGGRIKDQDDLNIMVQVLLIDSISSQDSGGMELVSPFPCPLFSISHPPSYPALLEDPTTSSRLDFPHPPFPTPPLCLDVSSTLILDRSNGFEKKYFQHQNTVARRTYQADQMGMEDM
jgi:hypothetical protein